MLRYFELEKRIGVRKKADFLTPRILDISDFSFSRSSTIHWRQGVPSPNDNILTNIDNVFEYIIPKYSRTGLGKYKRVSISLTALISARKKEVPEYKYLTDISKCEAVSSSKYCIVDYSELKSLYIYNSDKRNYRARLYNEYITIIDTINQSNMDGKIHYIHIDLPDTLLTYQEIKKVVKNENTSNYEKLVTNEKQYILIEIYKALMADYKESSIFNNVKNIDTSNIVFVFTHANKVTIARLYNILALSKETGLIHSRIKAVNEMQAIAILSKYLYKIIATANPMSITEIERRKDIVAVDRFNNDEEVDIKEIDKLIENQKEIATINISTENKPIKTDIKTTEDPVETAKLLVDDKVAKGIISEKKAKIIEEEVQRVVKEYKKYIPKPKELIFRPKPIPDMKTVFDKQLLVDTIKEYDEHYIRDIIDKERLAVIYSMSKFGYIVTSAEKKINDNLSNNEEIWNITVKQPTGTSVKLSIRIPIVTPGGIIRNNGKEYLMNKLQKDYIIKKINFNTVSMLSYYSKLFFVKANYSRYNMSTAIHKTLVNMSADLDNEIGMAVYGENSLPNIKVPYWYSIVMRETRSVMKGNWYLLFDYSNRSSLLNKEDDLKSVERHGILMGNYKKEYIVVDKDDQLYKVNSKGDILEELGDLLEFINIDKTKLPVEFVSSKMVGESFPVVIMFMYYLGIKPLLNHLDMRYRLLKNKRDLTSSEFSIKFSDGYYAFDKFNKSGALILGGLKSVEKYLSNIPFNSLNGESGVLDLMHAIGYPSKLSIAMKLFRAGFIGPLEVPSLEIKELPTDTVALLFKAIKMLETDAFTDPNSIETIDITGYERLNGMLYNVLTSAIRVNESKIGRVRTKLTLDPFIIYKNLASDAGFNLVDDLNPIQSVLQAYEVKLTGTFGRNKDTITFKNRSYYPDQVGYISEATKDSSSVGESYSLSATPKLMNTKGINKDIPIDELTPANIYSISALLGTDTLKDDGKRLLYTGVQTKHPVNVAGQELIPYRTDMADIIPYRVNSKHALHADIDGVVTKVTRNKIVIKYKTGKSQTYSLKSWYSKDTGGVTYKHTLKTLLKEGDRVQPGDNIYYDSGYFGPNFFNKKKVTYKFGVLATTVLYDSDRGYNDSTTISKEFADKLKTNIVYLANKLVHPGVIVVEYANVGDTVEYDSPVVTFITDEAIENVDNINPETVRMLRDINKSVISAPIKGKVTNFEIIYNFELDDCKDARLKEMIAESDKRLKESTGMTGRVDNTYSYKGKGIEEGEYLIKYYIEKELGMYNGDKLIAANQLKATVGGIHEPKYTSGGRVIDLYIDSDSVAARIVESAKLMGLMNYALVHMSEKAVMLYDK